MNRSLFTWTFVALALATSSALAFKTRSEVLSRTADRWTGANRIESDRLLNDWNPTLAVPNPRDIIAGRDPRPLAKGDGPYPIVGERSTVRFSWASGPVSVGIDRSGDGSEPFIDRAVHGYKRLYDSVPHEASIAK